MVQGHMCSTALHCSGYATWCKAAKCSTALRCSGHAMRQSSAWGWVGGGPGRVQPPGALCFAESRRIFPGTSTACQTPETRELLGQQANGFVPKQEQVWQRLTSSGQLGIAAADVLWITPAVLLLSGHATREAPMLLKTWCCSRDLTQRALTPASSSRQACSRRCVHSR